MDKKRAKKGISSKLSETPIKWTIRHDLVFIVVYAGTYRSVSADTLTSTSADQIETWADEIDSEWIYLPDQRYIFCNTVNSDLSKPDLSPFKRRIEDESPSTAVEWGPVGYTACSPAVEFGLIHSQNCDRNPFVGGIAALRDIPILDKSRGPFAICGDWETELDLRDFPHFARRANAVYGFRATCLRRDLRRRGHPSEM